MNITHMETIVLNTVLQVGATLTQYASIRMVFTEGPNNTSRIWILNSLGERYEVLSNDCSKANLTVTVSYEDMSALLKGELDSRMAYMQGKVLLDGDLGIAIELEKGLVQYVDSYTGKQKMPSMQ